MARFVAARLAHAIVVCFLVTTVAFFLLHAAPGDPFSFDNPRISAEIRDVWRAQFGYDRPLLEQYGRYLGSIATGQLGFSHSLAPRSSRSLRTGRLKLGCSQSTSDASGPARIEST